MLLQTFLQDINTFYFIFLKQDWSLWVAASGFKFLHNFCFPGGLLEEILWQKMQLTHTTPRWVPPSQRSNPPPPAFYVISIGKSIRKSPSRHWRIWQRSDSQYRQSLLMAAARMRASTIFLGMLALTPSTSRTHTVLIQMFCLHQVRHFAHV